MMEYLYRGCNFGSRDYSDPFRDCVDETGAYEELRGCNTIVGLSGTGSWVCVTWLADQPWTLPMLCYLLGYLGAGGLSFQ